MSMKPGDALRDKTAEQLDDLLAAADRSVERLEVRADVGEGPDATQKVNAVMAKSDPPPSWARGIISVIRVLPKDKWQVLALGLLIAAAVVLTLRGFRVIP